MYFRFWATWRTFDILISTSGAKLNRLNIFFMEIEKQPRLYEKFNNGEQRYRTDAFFHHIIDVLEHSPEGYIHVIEHLLSKNKEYYNIAKDALLQKPNIVLMCENCPKKDDFKPKTEE